MAHTPSAIHPPHRRKGARLVALALGSILPAMLTHRSGATTPFVSFVPISPSSGSQQAYGVNDLNSVGISRDNLATVGNYQYTAYYNYNSSASSAMIVVGRRATNSSSWTLVTTPYSISTSANGSDSIITNAIDDHDVVAMAVDGNGDMHLSWGMHNIPLNYSISTPVNGSTFNPVFTTQTSTNNPNLFSEFTSSGIYQATYPEFYYIPNSNGSLSGNLLFDIRNSAAASGGGSGNGNTFFNIYNQSTGYNSSLEVLNGGQTSVNGYQNNLTYDHAGNLLYSWTWRGSSNWQTNQNIMFAQSTDNGQTWTQQGGSPTYTLPIIANNLSGGSASQVAQVIENIPQQSSLINTTGMTVDANNNPIIATWWTPDGIASPASGNPNRQYMLVYYTGSAWKTSQITDRTTDTAFDTSGNDVRDLGRPLVMVDQQGRVLVVTRSDTTMGGFRTNGAGNNIVVYWNTIASLDSSSPNAWQPITLDTANMGEWEPSMDYNLWNSTNILNLFYEPSGFTGQTTGQAQVLQWNEPAYFAAATPANLTWDPNPASGLQDGTGVWDSSHTNFSDGSSNYAWNNSYAVNATFGVNNGTAGVVTLGSNISAETITFNAAGSGNYNIAGGGYTLSLTAPATIYTNTNATLSAPLVVTGNLTKLGAGTLTLGGNNSFSAKIVLGSVATTGGNVNGALRITSAAAVSGVTEVDFNDGGTAYDFFQIDGTNGNITLPSTLTFNMFGASTIASSNTIENIAGNNVINGSVVPNVYGNQYTLQSDSGSLTLNSNFNLGTLTTTRYLNLTGPGNGTISGVLGNGTAGGTLGLTKMGSGTWNLSNTNTYTGLTNVSAGTLVLSAGASLASPAINVSTGATLSVFGTLNSSSALIVNGSVLFQPTTSGLLSRTLTSLNISSGGLVSVINPSNHSNRTLLVLNSFQLSGGTNAWQGTLDLSSNDLILHNGSTGTLFNQIAQGYAHGQWNTTGGITSSAAAADPTHLTTLGVIQNSQNQSPTGTLLYGSGGSLGQFDGTNPLASDVLVKYTYEGDANLDGQVTTADYTLIDNGYLTQSTGWYNGDFNYDGTINGSDYTLIDNAFNTQAAPLRAEIASPPVSITDQIALPAIQVPEPVALPGLVFTMTALIRRPRKGAPDIFGR